MIEHELKYVLKLNCEADIIQYTSQYYLITQGYLPSNRNSSLRLRKRVDVATQYFFTFKFKDKDIIEIENEIQHDEFKRLWKFTKNRLIKRRYVYSELKEEKWDIDFFLFKDKVYFAMAEVEMFEGVKKPSVIPEFIKKNIIYEVPLNNCKFSSKKLSSVKHASKLRKEIGDASVNA